jgi:cobalt-zinc-cadmium efflux system protein
VSAHAHHHHHGPEDASARRLAIALGLLLALMAGEVVAGVLAHSLALISDAAHMLTDAAALGLALVAARLAARPAEGAMTYGLGRTEILSAQFNGGTLLVLGLLIVYEAVRRLVTPPPVAGGVVLAVALAGVAVNMAATWVLHGADRSSLNVEGAFQHVLTDLVAFIATALAGLVILVSGWRRADGVASLFVALVMLRAAWALLRESGRVFLEAAPRGVDVDAIGRAMVGVRGVQEVHDLHVWEVTSGFPALSAHVLVGHDDDCHGARATLERLLHDSFAIEHTTLQVEHEPALLQIEGTEAGGPGPPYRGRNSSAVDTGRPPGSGSS